MAEISPLRRHMIEDMTVRNLSPATQRRFFGNLAALAEPEAFATRLEQLRRVDWVVCAKPSFGGPEQVLAYLGRYTHRVHHQFWQNEAKMINIFKGRRSSTLATQRCLVPTPVY
jgi:hypothetical protein